MENYQLKSIQVQIRIKMVYGTLKSPNSMLVCSRASVDHKKMQLAEDSIARDYVKNKSKKHTSVKILSLIRLKQLLNHKNRSNKKKN